VNIFWLFLLSKPNLRQQKEEKKVDKFFPFLSQTSRNLTVETRRKSMKKVFLIAINKLYVKNIVIHCCF
jgi:hypothetical protein